MNQDAACDAKHRRQTVLRSAMRPFCSFIRTLTVGLGVSPNLLTFLRVKEALAGYTAGGDLHPALSLPDYSGNAQLVCMARPCKPCEAPLSPSPMSTPRKPPIAKSAARLGAVQALYQMDLSASDVGETLAQFSSRVTGEDFDAGECGEADYKHLRDVVEGTVREQALIDVTVDQQLDKNWPIHRINAILRAVLRAGAFEIMFKENVPAKVAINEYVNVASAFFDKEEPAMANAVLHALARARRPQEFPS